MRWTQTLIPTQKETPADAQIVSHQLMIRAGLIRQLTAGVYDFLPLGLRALQKAAAIVREQGATELLTSYSEGPGDPSGFYASVGFVPTGGRHEGEVLVRLTLGG